MKQLDLRSTYAMLIRYTAVVMSNIFATDLYTLPSPIVSIHHVYITKPLLVF